MAATDCVFCRIANREASAEIVSQDADVVAFRDLNPKAPTHVLLIPRKHISSVNDVEPHDAELVGKLFVAARAVAAAAGLNRRGYRLVVNTGADSGQSVHHLHMHLLGGRALRWPPG